MCVRAFVVLMQCTLAHHIKFVRASCVKFHTLLNNNKGQIRLNLISHVFTLNMNFPGYQFLVEKSVLNGRNGTVFALRFSGPPSWMRERVRSRIKSHPSGYCFVRRRNGGRQRNQPTATSRPPARDIRDTVNPPRGFDQSAMLTSYRVWDYIGWRHHDTCLSCRF